MHSGIRTHSRRLRMVGVGAATAGLALAMASPASAHDSSATLSDPGSNRQVGHGGVNANHRHVWICDDWTDQKGVTISWRLRNGDKGSIGDPNGSQPGCSGAFPGRASNPITWYWINYDGGISTAAIRG